MLWKLLTVAGNVVAVGTQTHSELFHFMCDLKDAQMNLQQSNFEIHAL